MPQHVIHFPATDPATAQRHHPINKKGCKVEGRQEAKGKKKKKKLRKVGLEVELRRDKRINQTSDHGHDSGHSSQKSVTSHRRETLLYPSV